MLRPGLSLSGLLLLLRGQLLIGLLLLDGHLAIVLALTRLPHLSVLVGCCGFGSHDVLLLDAARLRIELLKQTDSSTNACLRMDDMHLP